MNKMSTKNLILGLISLCAPIFLLIGLAISGGFYFTFYDIWILISILDIFALLASIVLIVINIVFLATRKRLREVEMISVIVPTAIMFLRLLVNTVVRSTLVSEFIFLEGVFVAFLLTVVLTIIYFVCNAKLPDDTKDGTVSGGTNTTYMYSANDVDGAHTSGCNEETVGATMSDSHIDSCIMMLKDFVPAEKLPYLRNELEKASDKEYRRILSLPLKKPMIVILFSIFLGGWGVDRFYIGDIGIGVLKLLFCWLTCYIWVIVDIFLCNKKVKEKNLEQIMLCLGK